MVENYYIQGRRWSSYTEAKNAKGKKIYGYKEYYRTNLGEIEADIWRTKITEAIEQAGEREALEIIKDHCRNHCAWLNKEVETSDYAMDILAGRVFLCGNPCWKEVEERILEKYFIFCFAGKEKYG